jgi:type I restriction enzyme, S subunit
VILNLDKTTWKRVAFGDVVNNVNETVRNGDATGIDRIIAMEHMDPGELKVQRWGSTEKGTTFTRRVKPGQTLFGKRRAYQRKVAFAEFDAICSGDIYTFEADETQLRREMLPFIVQSNGFFDHALNTSAGSLSPRTNWRDLANFEFDLPPIADQRRLADLLWAVEQHRLSVSRMYRDLHAAYERHMEETYRSAVLTGVPVRLGDVLKQIKRPVEVDPAGSYKQIGVRSHGRGIFAKESVSGEELRSKKVYWVEPGDLVINIVFAWEGATALMPAGLEGYCGSHRFPTYRRSDEGEIDFFHYYFKTADGVGLLGACSPGGAGRNRTLNRTRLMDSTFHLPNPEIQRDAVAGFRVIEAALGDIEAELSALTRLRAGLLAEIFGGD